LIQNLVVPKPPFHTQKETRLKTAKIAILSIGLLAVAGNASASDWTAICFDRHGRNNGGKASAVMVARPCRCPHIHRVFSNLKTWLIGTHHGVEPRYLPNDLDEFVFRFNRRHTPMAVFQTVLGIASGKNPVTLAQ